MMDDAAAVTQGVHAAAASFQPVVVCRINGPDCLTLSIGVPCASTFLLFLVCADCRCEILAVGAEARALDMYARIGSPMANCCHLDTTPSLKALP